MAATIVIRKYAPGLVTGLALNLPLAIVIICVYLDYGINIRNILTAMTIIGIPIVLSLKYILKLAGRFSGY